MFKNILLALMALVVVGFCPRAMAADGGDKKTTDTITLEVDYNADFDELMKKCDFDWQDQTVTAANFPTDGEGTVELEFKIFLFTKYMTADQAVVKIVGEGFRPAQPIEFLTYITQGTALGKGKPAVCLGQVWREDEDNDICGGKVICAQKITSPKSGWSVRAICRTSRLFAGWPLLAVRNKTLE